MKLFCLVVLAFLAGCAGYGGRGLAPGQSTEADVRALMGEPAMVREAPDGGTVLWYPRLPYGRESFAARVGKDGRLVSLEQRLTEANVARLVPNQSSREHVLDTLGPPYRIYDFPNLERKVWEYQMQGLPMVLPILYVQLSEDGVVREVFQLDERSRRPDPPGRGLGFGFGLRF